MNNMPPNTVYTNPAEVPQSQAPPEFYFGMNQSRFKNTVWKYIGAVVMVVLAVFCFIAMIFSPSSNVGMTGGITPLLIFAVMLYSMARNEDKSPRDITVGPYGLKVTLKKGSVTYPWTDLGWAKIAKNSWSFRKELDIFDKQGKQLLKVDDTIQYFDYFVQIVNYNISLQGDGSADRIRGTKSKRNGIGILVAGTFFLAISCACIWFAHDSQAKEEQLRTQGVKGQAQIVKLFVAPNGVNHIVTYSIKSQNGKVGEHDAQVSQSLWRVLGMKKTVPVIYVPSDPDNTQLAYGERKVDDFDPMTMYVMSIFMIGLSIFFLIAGAVSCKGLDVSFDSATFKIKVKKYGEG